MTVLEPVRGSAAVADGQGKHRVLVLDDQVIEIVHTYFASASLALHSLRYPASYDCSTCAQRQESAMVAVGCNAVVCPACFAANAVSTRGRNHGSQARGEPGQRRSPCCQTDRRISSF